MRVAIVFLAWFLLAAFMLRWLHVRGLSETYPEVPAPGVRTVVWKHDNGYELQAFTGTVEGFDDWSLVITDDRGYWVLVDAERIVAVYS